MWPRWFPIPASSSIALKLGIVALAVVVASLVAGDTGKDEPPATCTGSTGTATTSVGTTSTAGEEMKVRVYWLRDGRVWPALREVEEGEDVVTAALEQLLAGPTSEEEADLDATTAIPEGTEIEALTIEDAVARLELSTELPDEALAQVVHTLTSSPTLVLSMPIGNVEVAGRSLTRGNFEDLVPPILIESPLPCVDLTSPLNMRGTTSLSESGSFQYELIDPEGRLIDESSVSGGVGLPRSAFDFTTEFTVAAEGAGALVVFEISGKDDSRINVVEIPLRMMR